MFSRLHLWGTPKPHHITTPHQFDPTGMDGDKIILGQITTKKAIRLQLQGSAEMGNPYQILVMDKGVKKNYRSTICSSRTLREYLSLLFTAARYLFGSAVISCLI